MDWTKYNFDDREIKEIGFARTYAANFAHGTAGHNRLMLISEMADLISQLDYDLHIVKQKEGRIDESDN